MAAFLCVHRMYRERDFVSWLKRVKGSSYRVHLLLALAGVVDPAKDKIPLRQSIISE